MVRSIHDLELSGRVTFIRVDFNVPLDGEGRITDDTRIRAALPTIELARKMNARVVLASHLGRPKGRPDPDQSLEPAAGRLAELLQTEVGFADDCVGDGVRKNVRDLRDGQVLLLENTRFHPGEEKNDEEFAKALSEGVEVYVNDAFGAAHRAHASTAGIARFVRDKGVGLLMKRELEYLGRLSKEPEQPFVAVIGGAKVSDKIGVLQSLLDRCQSILIGGAMAYTLMKARGLPTGNSRVESDKVAVAERLLKSAAARRVQLMLPEDHMVAQQFSENAPAEAVTEIREGFMGLDIGPRTRQRYDEILAKARTIFWNGPMGVFEWPAFAEGTFAVARSIAASSGISVVGGGDSVSALNRAGLAERVSHVSTGGGASLELLEGKTLPGVAVLEAS